MTDGIFTDITAQLQSLVTRINQPFIKPETLHFAGLELIEIGRFLAELGKDRHQALLDDCDVLRIVHDMLDQPGNEQA